MAIAVTALWLGLVVTLALVAAPTLFAMLDRVVAGRLAGQMFRIEAYTSLVAAVVLLLLERRRWRYQAGTPLSPEILLVAAALFCTVLGYFGLQPMMDAAKAGLSTPWGFGVLHGVSTAFFASKGFLLLALLWRLAGR